MNWIGLVLCLFTLATHFFFRWEFPRSMPFWLALVCSILHSVLLIGPITDYDIINPAGQAAPAVPLCLFQGAAIQFSCVAIYCWLFLIAMHLFFVVVQKYQISQIMPYTWLIHVFAWLTPTLATALPLIFLKFEDRGVWCWVLHDENGAWEIGAFYAPLALVLLTTSFFWICIVFRACQVSSQFKTSYYVFQTTLGLLLFIISFAAQFFHRMFNLSHKHNTTFSLELIHTIMLSCVGYVVFFYLWVDL